MALYIKLFLQICAGLKEVHEKLHYHKDIKPENIFLKGENLDSLVVKIGDFGIVREFSGAPTLRTKNGDGTFLYWPPERLKYDSHGHKADVWAIGVILYEMIAGKHPFDHEDGMKIFKNIKKNPFNPLPKWAGDDINTIISRLLSKKAADRPEIS